MDNLRGLGNRYSYNLDFTMRDLTDLDLRPSVQSTLELVKFGPGGFSSLILELAMSRDPVSWNFGTEFVGLRPETLFGFVVPLS